MVGGVIYYPKMFWELDKGILTPRNMPWMSSYNGVERQPEASTNQFKLVRMIAYGYKWFIVDKWFGWICESKLETPCNSQSVGLFHLSNLAYP